MDLGRPVARHRITRPHEAVDLDPRPVDEPVAEVADAAEPLASEQPER